MTYVATTYHPKSVRNRCVIERFVASLCYFDLGVIVMPLHQIPFLFANWRADTLNSLFEKKKNRQNASPKNNKQN